ncbi:MAG TPA: alpha-L-fucosidase [Terracidiphilus sp.]|nr:alpha-L-fucosidase [Terracidiphilus sp.]
MHRRDFCKILGASATALAAGKGWARSPGAEDAENADSLDYARYCAMPESERTFQAVVDGKITTIKLDAGSWKPTEWGNPPKLPGGVDSWDGVPMQAPISGLAGSGPYAPTWESLQQYEAPEWYQDAKFGIWAHWSPQCVAEKGDWYGRNMYIEGQRQYKYHLEHYGPPSRFGYKDLCAQWTLLNWEPEALLDRYKKAGARFFFALANHHDGFDCWDSKHQPWNAVKMGPHRDVTGIWAKAARDRGLRFGATIHEGRNWWWFQPSHGADKQGPQAGVPYDGELTLSDGKNVWWKGNDPQRLYGPKHPFDALPDPSYVKNFYDRTRDFIDQHNPDILYFDNPLFPLGWGGMNIAAYYYNNSLARRGKMDVVANIKNVPDNLAKTVVADYERGLTSGIMPHAWQSETCIGEWHYNRDLYDKPGEFGGYLNPRDVIHWLVDTVSKNGTFVLNIPGKPDGTIDSKEIAVLDRITAWMGVNGEAIYETRPWKIYGEGPNAIKAGAFQGNSVSKLGAQDVRFTRSKDNKVVYAIVLGLPAGEMNIEALGLAGANSPGKIAKVEVLGSTQAPQWRQAANGLSVKIPNGITGAPGYGVALKAWRA